METSVSLVERLVGVPTDDDWRRLLDLYRPLLRAWMTRAGVPPADADDLVQDVLLVAFREVGGFERRGQGAFRGWLRTILAHLMRDCFRRQKHRPTATGDSDFLRRLDELESPASPLSRLWDREHDEYVAASLLRRVQGDFAPPTWQAFVRHVLEGEQNARVAEELGLSLNSVVLARAACSNACGKSRPGWWSEGRRAAAISAAAGTGEMGASETFFTSDSDGVC